MSPLFSPVSAGGLGKATVTASTGSPTIDSSTRAGKTIYKFTGSGSITVGTAGTCEILVIGGGGAAGDNGAGGGAGGLIYDTSAILPAGTLTVTIGGSGTASKLNTFYAAGGGFGSSCVNNSINAPGGSGGSGGGGERGTLAGAGGSGISGQGFAGGSGSNPGQTAGGGGGAGGAGGSNRTSGAGSANSITGTSVTYCIGGGTSSRSLANSGDGNNQTGFVVVVVG